MGIENNKFNEETTESLRFDMESQIVDLQNTIEESQSRLNIKEQQIGIIFKTFNFEI